MQKKKVSKFTLADLEDLSLKDFKRLVMLVMDEVQHKHTFNLELEVIADGKIFLVNEDCHPVFWDGNILRFFGKKAEWLPEEED